MKLNTIVATVVWFVMMATMFVVSFVLFLSPVIFGALFLNYCEPVKDQCGLNESFENLVRIEWAIAVFIDGVFLKWYYGLEMIIK